MSQEDLRTIVGACRCTIDGVTYRFKLQWAALNVLQTTPVPRHLLSVEAFATAIDHSETLSLCIVTADFAELPTLLEDAFRIHLREQLTTTRHTDPAADQHTAWR